MQDTRSRRVLAAGAVAAVAITGIATAVPAGAATGHAHGSLTTLATVDNPRKLAFAPDGTIYVASAGHGGKTRCLAGGEESDVTCLGASSSVVQLGAKGSRTTVVGGLPSLASPAGFSASGAAAVAFGPKSLAVVMQDAGVDKKGHNPWGAGGSLLGHVLTTSVTGGKVSVGADLAAYEAKNDPDKKNPTIDDSTVDSDPYSIAAYKDGWVLTDAAANDLLYIDAAGKVSTLAVFPTQIESISKAIVTGNPADAKTLVQIPVQSVPTSVAVAKDGSLYVGELTGFPFGQNKARIWKVTPGSDLTKTVKPALYASNFTAISDLAFDPSGQLYVLEFATGPFLSTPGALIRLNKGGGRTTVASKGLIDPTGLAISKDGAIVVSNGGDLPATGKIRGSVVRVWP